MAVTISEMEKLIKIVDYGFTFGCALVSLTISFHRFCSIERYNQSNTYLLSTWPQLPIRDV